MCGACINGKKFTDRDFVKGAWTKEGGQTLELVNKYGANNWFVITQKLPRRIGKQCRER